MERVVRAAGALGIRLPQGLARYVNYILIFALALSGVVAPTAVSAAGSLTASSVSLSDPTPSTSGVSYTLTASGVDGVSAIKCVKAVWSVGTASTQAPAGFSGASGSVAAASSTLINSSATNWSLAKSDGTSSSGQNNIYKYTNSASGIVPSTTTAATFVFSGITNASTPDTAYFLVFNTYGNTDCASSPIDNAVVLFTNTNSSLLSLTVDPSLSFSVGSVSSGQPCDGTTTTGTSTSSTIAFGNVNAGANSIVCQDLAASTNATGGYSIYLRYTAKPTSFSNTIADHTGTNSSPTAFSAAGTEAYGYTTDDATLGTGTADRFTNPVQGWAAATTSNAEIGYEPTAGTTVHFQVGHQVGVSPTTPEGAYTTTIIYTCTPVF